MLYVFVMCLCVIVKWSLSNKSNAAQSGVGRTRCESIWHNRKQTVEQCVGGEYRKEGGRGGCRGGGGGLPLFIAKRSVIQK